MDKPSPPYIISAAATLMDAVDATAPLERREWLVNSLSTPRQDPLPNCYHLTVHSPQPLLIFTGAGGPNLTHLMAESILNKICEDQGEPPLLMWSTELMSNPCPKLSRSQCQRPLCGQILVPYPFRAQLHTLPMVEKSTSGRPSRRVLQ